MFLNLCKCQPKVCLPAFQGILGVHRPQLLLRPQGAGDPLLLQFKQPVRKVPNEKMTCTFIDPRYGLVSTSGMTVVNSTVQNASTSVTCASSHMSRPDSTTGHNSMQLHLHDVTGTNFQYYNSFSII